MKTKFGGFMKKVNHKILMPIMFCLVMIAVYFINKDEKKDEEPVKKALKFNERVEEKDIKEQVEGLDINLASADELKEVGISKSIAEKIIEYREMTGTIIDFSELRRVKGIGEKSLEKIKKVLTLDEENIGQKNKININEATDEELLFFGFTKKELQNIEKWKNTKGDIFSNIDLIRIVGEKRYEKLKNDIKY